MAWPTKWVVLTGALTATVGAGMQALAGAPRLLQAIGEDQILPALGFFSVKWHGEPIRGLFMTYLIAELGILIAFLDYVAPIVTMFFLMCYGFINFAVTLQSLVDTPHWRPSYRCYHWTITLLGTALCVTTMFVCDWIYALVAIVLAFLLYEYIEYKGAEKEWGDGCTGLSMSAAIFALNKLNKEFHHTKNWRPQILVLLKMADVGDDLTQFSVDDSRLVMLSSMLKEGRGLTMYGTVIKGKLSEMSKEQEELRTRISECLSNSGVKGFVEVVINPSVTDGMSCMIQSAGLGALRPNTIILGWPHDWIEKRSLTSYQIFLETMRNVALTKNATIILKACSFPSHLARMSGTIDVWWVVNDGGMLLLLAHLLRRSKTWGKCKLRLFSVAQEEDNTVQIKKDLKTYLYELRVEGTVEVVEMAADDMSAYVYERTLKMEQRTRMLQSLIRKKTSIVPVPLGSQRKILEKKEVQSVLENARSAFDFGKRKEDFSSQTDMISSPQKAPPSSENLRHMNTAIGLNKLIKERSSQADLVILNLPCVPESSKGQANYMSFLEVLTESIERILLVRGTGNEVITAFN